MAKMETIAVDAYAKVNFTLDILGRAEGYHLLDSLVCTVDLADKVIVTRRTDRRMRITAVGEGASAFPARSNAQRAADAFSAAFHTDGADIVIERRIPAGAGLGSSSADAAGVLRALAKLYAVSDMVRLKSLADALGSDTGYLLTGGWARITGRGERVQPIADMPPLYLVLLLPPAGVSTAACFAAYDCLAAAAPPQTERALSLLRTWGARGAAACGNALTAAACACNAQVGGAFAAAMALGGEGCGMTGSGSACYAVFASEEAARSAAGRTANYRALCVRTVQPGERPEGTGDRHGRKTD